MGQTIEFHPSPNGKCEAVVVGHGSISTGSLGEFHSEEEARLYALRLFADCDYAFHYPGGRGHIRVK